jgi:hypothetical protein
VTGRSDPHDVDPADGTVPADEPPSADPALDDLAPEAVEEARRWKDFPTQDPESSTGLDV